MKKILSVIFALILVSGLFTLSGCTPEPEQERSAVCYVVANTANSKGLNLQSPLVQDTAYDTIRNYGYISVINADKSPSVALSRSFDIADNKKSASKDKLDMEARTTTTNLLSGMASVIADDPEVDYHESLRVALQSLNGLEGYDSKKIIVIGNGLSTTGVIDFNNNLLCVEPEVVVEHLKEKNEILDFSDITVYWQQMAETASPQKPLSSNQRIRMQNIYSGFVEAGGGKFEPNDFLSLPENNSIDYPQVTPVDLPAEAPVSFEPENIDENAFKEPEVLGEDKVAFVGGTDEYIDSQKVKEVLQPISDYLVGNPSVKLLLVGSVAGDESDNESLTLSSARADKVRETLISLGVNSDQLISIGMGADSPWHIDGAGYEGAVAAANRSVTLIDATTETAKTIMEETNP